MDAFEILFNDARVAFALCDMTGKLLNVNPAYARLIGRTVEETLRLSYWNITPTKYKRQEATQVRKLKTTGHYGPYQKEYLHKDHSLVPVSLEGWVITLDGKKRILSIVQDLREELAHQAYVGLALCDMKGKLLAVNRYYAEMLGYTIGEILQLKYWDITPGTFRDQEEMQLDNLRRTKVFGPYNKKYRNKRGRLVDVWLVGRIVEINGENYIWSVVQPGMWGGDVSDYFLPTTTQHLPRAKGKLDRPIKKK